MNIDTRKIGDIAEAKFVVFCLENNIEICKPINSGQHYDFIIKLDNTFKRVQIKNHKLSNGAIKDITRHKLQKNRKGPLIDYTKNELIDLYIVYCPDTDTFYNIPLDALRNVKYTLSLRVNVPKNNQCKGISLAKNYIFSLK